MMSENFVGWDIGGAHIKMAQINNMGKVISACQFPAPVWLGLDRLTESVCEAKKKIIGEPGYHSVTTTAELSDIFPDRKIGLENIARIISNIFNKEVIHFYAGNAGWVESDQVGQFVREIASANWHATASYVAYKRQEGILIDIGSTTTDIVPFKQGCLLNKGYTDFERLMHQELVYTGIVRTPVMAIVDKLPVEKNWLPVIPENFATTADIYRLTGEINNQDDMMETPDGAGKSEMESARRLARMVAVDVSQNGPIKPWRDLAMYIADIHLEKITKSLKQVVAVSNIQNPTLVGAGAGRFLARKIAQYCNYSYVDFADILDVTDDIKPLVSRSAAAVAVAQLSRSKN